MQKFFYTNRQVQILFVYFMKTCSCLWRYERFAITQIEGYKYKLSISGRLAPKCEEAGGPDARGGIECLSVVAADEPGAQQTDVRGLRNTKY